jgi:chromosomal replication initiation ATPase DnaA
MKDIIRKKRRQRRLRLARRMRELASRMEAIVMGWEQLQKIETILRHAEDAVFKEHCAIICGSRCPLALVAAALEIAEQELVRRDRHQDVAFKRGVAMTLIRRIWDLSFTELGIYFHRDHSTVQNAIHRVEWRERQSFVFAKSMATLERRVREGAGLVQVAA